MILAQLAHFASHTVNSLALFQEETVSFSPMGLWNHMGWLARCVAILLFIESIWSLAVMIDRYLYFSAARKQSREFAPKVAGALKDSKLEEAIKIAELSISAFPSVIWSAKGSAELFFFVFIFSREVVVPFSYFGITGRRFPKDFLQPRLCLSLQAFCEYEKLRTRSLDKRLPENCHASPQARSPYRARISRYFFSVTIRAGKLACLISSLTFEASSLLSCAHFFNCSSSWLLNI